MPRPLHGAPSTLADNIRQILALRGLSLGAVSDTSRLLTPGNRLQHIPHNLYSSLRNRRFRPNLHQVFALSVITGYRFADWLSVFGFWLDDIPRFQAAFPTLRTVEIDAGSCQREGFLPWYHETRAPDFSAPLMPLGQWLTLAKPTLHAFSISADSMYRYAKIGSQDAFAYPDLVPGSIIRIIAVGPLAKLPPSGENSKNRLFLVALRDGLVCAHLRYPTPGTFVLCSRQLPYAPVELQDGRDAVVVGVADFEIRPLGAFEKPFVPARLGRFWSPQPLSHVSRPAHVGEFIRKARFRAGISFREASKRTRIIADTLGDLRYYCAPGSLSDYEARRLPPRHIHKLISICAVYFARFADVLDAAGISRDKAGTAAIPPELLGISTAHTDLFPKSSVFFSELERRFGRLPYFLQDSAAALFGLRKFSIRDIFWAGRIRGSIRTGLAGALFLAVDRKRKNPRPALSCPKSAQPVYVLQQRDGHYLCGFCTLEDNTLILRSCLKGVPKLVRLRNRIDAEVVGRVVGVARHLC